MEDMSMDVTQLSDKIHREATEKNVAYDVGEHYLQAFDKEGVFYVTLFDHNFKTETQEIYGELQNKELPPLTQAIHEFCEKYDFEGVESVQNRTAPMIDPAMLEYNFLQAKETTQVSLRIEDEFLDKNSPAFAVFRLKDNEKNEPFSQIDLNSLEMLGEVPDKHDYNCIYSADLGELMKDYLEVMDTRPEVFVEQFESALYENIDKNAEFVWNFNELLDSDVIGLEYGGESTYFYNDKDGLEVINFEQQPFKLSLRSDEIPSPTLVDLNSISIEELLNLVGNYENVENVVREVVPLLQARDELMRELEEIDSDILYQDFDIVKSEVISYMEVALLTNSTQDVFVVSDRGAFSEKEVNDNQWVTPMTYDTLEDALVGYDDRIYSAMEMTGTFEEMEQQDKAQQESQQTQDVEENPTNPLVEATVLSVKSIELAVMMEKNSDFSAKVDEAIDFKEINKLLEERLPENDLRSLQELGANMLDKQGIDKADTFQLVSDFLNNPDLDYTMEDVKMVRIEDIAHCIDFPESDMDLEVYVLQAHALENAVMDNSPEFHAEIQSFFEEPVPTADLEKFSELITKTAIVSYDTPKSEVFEYLIQEIGDGYIDTSDLHHLTPQDVDKAMNSHGGILVDKDVQLENVVARNRETATAQESEAPPIPLADERTSFTPEQKLQQEDVADTVAYQVGDKYVLFEKEDNKATHSVFDENFVMMSKGGFGAETINKEVEMFVAAYSLESMEQLESRSAPIVDTKELLEKVAQQKENPIETSEQVQGFSIVEKESVDNTEIFMGENAYGQFATFTREVTEDGSGKWENPHIFSGDDYATNHEKADKDFDQRVDFHQPVEKPSVSYEKADVVAIPDEENLFSASLTTQERVLIKESTEFIYDYVSDIPEEEREIMSDIMIKMDDKGDLLKFYPSNYVFEPNEALQEVSTIVLTGEELKVIASACDETSKSWDDITKDYTELLDNVIDKVSNPQTVPNEISNEVTQEPRTVADYIIIDSKVVGDFEVALGESEQGMYATWERNITADESKGFEANWDFGRYHMEDIDAAFVDFEQRIEDNKPVKDTEKEKKVTAKDKNKEEKPPKESVLENLKKIKAETEKNEAPKLPTKDKTNQSL